MFFGGINGFNAFHPEQVTVNEYPPPVALTALTQGGARADFEGEAESLGAITFHWPNNYFEFEFAALEFTSPEKNQYAYMLENFDRDWVYSGDTRAGLIMKAMLYQIAKEIGGAAAALNGEVDAIFLTGGFARSPIIDELRKRVGWIGSVLVYPGEGEMIALAEAAMRYLRGEETPREY